MAHALEFFDHGLHTSGPDEEHLIGQPPDQILGELPPGQQFCGEHGVLGVN
jgi:hypothetical protein